MRTVTLYRPNVFENVLSDFDRYLDSFMGNNFVSPQDRIFNHQPSVDVRETENAYIIEADVPGFDENNIEIRLDGNTLIVESKKMEESTNEGTESCSKTRDGNYLVKERRISSFSRSFKMPENADLEGISASFKNGILSMDIKKKVEAQARIIQISKS